MAGNDSEDDLDAQLLRIASMAFKANGAGLTLAAVAASNILPNISIAGWLATAPAWIFLTGLTLAYFATAMSSLHDLHFSRLYIKLNYQEQIFEFEGQANPSDEMRRIADESRASMARLDSQLETPERMQIYITAFSWFLNLSLGAFLLGVSTGLVLIANK